MHWMDRLKDKLSVLGYKYFLVSILNDFDATIRFVGRAVNSKGPSREWFPFDQELNEEVN